MKDQIPICFYPTRKIVLDDDSIFVQSMLLRLDKKNYSSYTSPQCLLDYLFNEYNLFFRSADLFETEQPGSELSTYHNFHIPTKKLSSICAKTLVHDISVILVDYHMPNMTGISFLNQIKQFPFKKILITGEQDYIIGVDALNAGLVDAYIRKDDPDLLNKLNNMISVLEWKYFTELSASVYNISEFDYLKNKAFFKKFRQLNCENDITSFFLTNKEGDFENLNIKGEKGYIVVRTIKQLNELAILAQEDGASIEIINGLKQSKIIPFFGNKHHWEIPAAEWGTFLHPANLLVDDSNLVWAMISPVYPQAEEKNDNEFII